MNRRKAIEEVLKGWKEFNHNNENNIINYIARKNVQMDYEATK